MKPYEWDAKDYLKQQVTLHNLAPFGEIKPGTPVPILPEPPEDPYARFMKGD